MKITGESSLERSIAFGKIESYVAMTDGRFRLIEGAGNFLLFYDGRDPDNLTDSSKKHSERVARMSQAIDDLIEEIDLKRSVRFFR